MENLSKERMGEIALIVLLSKVRRDGITFKPEEIRRQILNEAKKLGLEKVEAALFAKAVATEIFKESMAKIDSIIIEKGE